MQVAAEIDGSKARLILSGRFDFGAHHEFRNGYADLLQDGGIREIEVDLCWVDYLDSSALGMLLLLKERAAAANKTVTLANCHGVVKQILDIANFNKLFAIR